MLLLQVKPCRHPASHIHYIHHQSSQIWVQKCTSTVYLRVLVILVNVSWSFTCLMMRYICLFAHWSRVPVTLSSVLSHTCMNCGPICFVAVSPQLFNSFKSLFVGFNPFCFCFIISRIISCHCNCDLLWPKRQKVIERLGNIFWWVQCGGSSSAVELLKMLDSNVKVLHPAIGWICSCLSWVHLLVFYK